MVSEPKRMKLDDSVGSRLYPVLPDELVEETPLVEVYVDEILDAKNISKAITEMNTLLPIPELCHLKRMKGKCILLFPVTRCQLQDVHTTLDDVGFSTTLLANKVRIVSVAQIPPKVHKQYVVVNKLWPCNFHSDKYLEKLSTNTVFSESEVSKHERYIRMLIDVSQYIDDKYGIKKSNCVSIVDPTAESVVAIGYDDTSTRPYKHAVMVGVDNVAKTQDGGVWDKDVNNGRSHNGDLDVRGIQGDILQHLLSTFSDVKFGARPFKTKSELEVPSDGPYLCTNYYMYSIQEPCVMCSMALVHSRIKRVFYGVGSKKGGLATLCKVHAVKELNHHFEVFGGLLESECRQLFE